VWGRAGGDAVAAKGLALARALRPCAVYRELTNGFRSEWGAASTRSTSVVETGAEDRSSRSRPSAHLDERPLPIGT